MRLAFLRVYAVVGLALVAAFWLVIEAGKVPLRMAPTLPKEAVETLQDAMLEPTSGRKRLAEMAQKYRVDLELAPKARVTAGLNLMERERLSRGEAILSFDAVGPIFAMPIPDQPLVVVARPEGVPSRSLAPIAASVLLLLATAAAVYWTMHPLASQLQLLTTATRQFGDGDLSARSAVRAHSPARELAMAFNRMARQVQEEVTGREELLQAVAHELRTPVARLRFAVELLVDTEKIEDRERRAHAIERDLEELNDLIGELLLYGSLRDEMNSMQLEEAPLQEMAQDAQRDGMAINPQVHVVIYDLPTATLLVDRRLFVRALSNLVRNGVRYTHSRVEIRAARRTHELNIWVDDDGPGVPPEDRERIFEPMVRLDAARTRDKGGVGLGLSLVQRIVRNHGGRVRCLESPLGGARFEISLPVHR